MDRGWSPKKRKDVPHCHEDAYVRCDSPDGSKRRSCQSADISRRSTYSVAGTGAWLDELRLSKDWSFEVDSSCVGASSRAHGGALSAPPPVLINDTYLIIKHLGAGSYGQVRLALNLEDHRLYAVKACSRKVSSPRVGSPRCRLSRSRVSFSATALSATGAASARTSTPASSAIIRPATTATATSAAAAAEACTFGLPPARSVFAAQAYRDVVVTVKEASLSRCSIASAIDTSITSTSAAATAAFVGRSRSCSDPQHVFAWPSDQPPTSPLSGGAVSSSVCTTANTTAATTTAVLMMLPPSSPSPLCTATCSWRDLQCRVARATVSDGGSAGPACTEDAAASLLPPPSASHNAAHDGAQAISVAAAEDGVVAVSGGLYARVGAGSGGACGESPLLRGLSVRTSVSPAISCPIWRPRSSLHGESGSTSAPRQCEAPVESGIRLSTSSETMQQSVLHANNSTVQYDGHSTGPTTRGWLASMLSCGALAGGGSVGGGGRGGSGRTSESAASVLLHEVAVMSRLSHPNIVKLAKVIDDPASDSVSLVMEYLEGGSLQQKQISPGRWACLDEPAVWEHTRDVLQGLAYLHRMGVVHSDIKPANLMVDRSVGITKIGDFGSAVFVSSIAIEQERLRAAGAAAPSLGFSNRSKWLTCTPAFRSPESLQAGYRPNFELDMWALGVCLHLWCFGVLPFKGSSAFLVYEAIRTLPLCLPAAPAISSELKHLLTGLLEKDPARRLSAPAALSHPWCLLGGHATRVSPLLGVPSFSVLRHNRDTSVPRQGPDAAAHHTVDVATGATASESAKGCGMSSRGSCTFWGGLETTDASGMCGLQQQQQANVAATEAATAAAGVAAASGPMPGWGQQACSIMDLHLGLKHAHSPTDSGMGASSSVAFVEPPPALRRARSSRDRFSVASCDVLPRLDEELRLAACPADAGLRPPACCPSVLSPIVSDSSSNGSSGVGEALADAFREVRYAPGQLLVQAGQAVDHVFFIARGEVELLQGDVADSSSHEPQLESDDDCGDGGQVGTSTVPGALRGRHKSGSPGHRSPSVALSLLHDGDLLGFGDEAAVRQRLQQCSSSPPLMQVDSVDGGDDTTEVDEHCKQQRASSPPLMQVDAVFGGAQQQQRGERGAALLQAALSMKCGQVVAHCQPPLPRGPAHQLQLLPTMRLDGDPPPARCLQPHQLHSQQLHLQHPQQRHVSHTSSATVSHQPPQHSAPMLTHGAPAQLHHHLPISPLVHFEHTSASRGVSPCNHHHHRWGAAELAAAAAAQAVSTPCDIVVAVSASAVSISSAAIAAAAAGPHSLLTFHDSYDGLSVLQGSSLDSSRYGSVSPGPFSGAVSSAAWGPSCGAWQPTGGPLCSSRQAACLSPHTRLSAAASATSLPELSCAEALPLALLLGLTDRCGRQGDVCDHVGGEGMAVDMTVGHTLPAAMVEMRDVSFDSALPVAHPPTLPVTTPLAAVEMRDASFASALRASCLPSLLAMTSPFGCGTDTVNSLMTGALQPSTAVTREVSFGDALDEAFLSDELHADAPLSLLVSLKRSGDSLGLTPLEVIPQPAGGAADGAEGQRFAPERGGRGAGWTLHMLSPVDDAPETPILPLQGAAGGDGSSGAAAGSASSPPPAVWRTSARARGDVVAYVATAAQVRALAARHPAVRPALAAAAERSDTELRVAAALRQLALMRLRLAGQTEGHQVAGRLTL